EPDVVQVHPVVAGVVVVLRRAVVVAVPGAVHLLEVARALALDLGEEALVDAAAPAAAAGLGDAERVLDQLLLLVDDLDQVAQRPDVEARGVDVDVDAAAAVDPGARAPHRPDDLLQGLEVVVGEDRADHLRLPRAVGVEARVGHHPPAAPVGRDDVVGVVAGRAADVLDRAADHRLDGAGDRVAGLADGLDLDAEAEGLHGAFSFASKGLASSPSRGRTSLRTPSKSSR